MPTPYLIGLDEAVSRIKQACEDSSDQKEFFFMVGAGISFPSVLLADGIIAHCRETAEQLGRKDEPQSTKAIDCYSHWFEKAYGEPQQRQKYLRGLIEKKQITQANFRLAHLLLDRTITNLVVTTNFDDFLSKALTLFGNTPIVCDHPQTVGRINLKADDLQIIHLHGTYWFYDCCNLTDELSRRALDLRETISTMPSLLSRILGERSPIVIGYSGWEGDVFMQELARRLTGTLENSVYWFCYRRDQVGSMPDWLKHHQNVRFVVPDEPAAPVAIETSRARDTTEARVQQAGEQGKTKGFVQGNNAVPSLPADRVLDKLILTFGLKTPLLTNDPIGFFAKQLEESLPKDDASDKDTDIYGIKTVIERVRRAKQRELAEAASTRSAGVSRTPLEEIRDAVRTADYREAIKLGSQLPLATLSSEQLIELADVMLSSALKLYDNSDDELAGYDLVVAVNDRLSAVSPQLGNARSEQVARALVNKGVTLETLERNEAAIAVYDEVVNRFGEASEAGLREQVARVLVSKGYNLGLLGHYDKEIRVYDELLERYGDASEVGIQKQIAQGLINKGVTLGMLNRGEEEVAMYDEVERRYGGSADIGLRERVARALFNKAVTHGMMNRGEDSVALYDDVLRRYGEATEIGLRERVAQSLVNKGFSLGALDRVEEEIATYDEVVRRYGEAAEIGLRREVAQALLNKGVRLGALNRGEEEVAVYDELVRRYGDAAEIELREPVARALFNKAIRLKAMDRDKEEVAVYEEIVRRYGEAAEPVLREQVARALNGIGFHSIIKAKAARLKGDLHRSHELLKQADQCFADAIAQIPDIAIILGNQAYAAFLWGRKDQSRELLHRAIALGGEAIRATELEDAGINRLPDDDEFCELVRSIPASPPSNQI